MNFELVKPKMERSKNSDEEVKALENEQYAEAYKVDYTIWKTRQGKYEENKVKAAALIWNQCNNTMKSKVQARKDYEKNIKGNPITLMQAIEQHAMN